MRCFTYFFFFKQKTAYEMRISDWSQTCALPISKPTWDEEVLARTPDPAAETAVILLGNSRGAGMHTLRWVLDTFPGRFANVVFVSVGEVDKAAFNRERTLK